jgi:excisionase family DNA binding protein
MHYAAWWRKMAAASCTTMTHDALTGCHIKPKVATYEGEGPVLTGPQACERLGVSRSTLLRLIKTGEIRAMKTADAKQSRWRIPEEAIDDYIRRRLTAAS